jgi:hypothetical protein
MVARMMFANMPNVNKSDAVIFVQRKRPVGPADTAPPKTL